MRRATAYLPTITIGALGVCLALTSPLATVHAQPKATVVADVGQMLRDLTRAYDVGADESAHRSLRAQLDGNAAAQSLLKATLDRLAFRYEDAERNYRRAAADSLQPAGAWATLGLAAVAGSRGGYVASMQLFAQASAQMARLGDRAGQTEALLGQSLTALRVLGVDSAATLVRAASATLPRDDTELRARHECVQMQVRVRAGTAIADSTWGRVLANTSPYGNRLRAECLFVRAQYLESLGKAAAAGALLDTVAEAQRAARMWNALSATRQWQGSAHLSRGNYGLARAALTEALALAKRSASIGGEGWATHELGRIAQRLGASGDAARQFATARALFADANDRTGTTFANRSLAEGALLRGDLGAADSLYREFAASSSALAPQLEVSALVARSDIARRQSDPARSVVLLDSAAVLAAAYNQPGWKSEIRYHRGLVALATGQNQRAIAQWDTLLRQQNLRGPARFEVVSRWAEAQAADGRLDEAWTTFGSAARTLDRWSSGFRERGDVMAMLQDRAFEYDRDLGLATMVSRFASAGRAPEALAMVEWRRVRGKEQAALQRGALSIDASRATGVAVRGVDTAALDPRRFPALARARLAPAHAIVSFIVGHGNEPTTAFVLTRDTLISIALAPIDSLAPRIERFVGFLQAGRVLAPLAQYLSGELIAPVITVLPADVRRLVIVPDGELHRLPFVALTHPAGDGLLDHVELAVAPTMDDALGSALSVARRPSADEAQQALIVGAPQRMPNVPGTTTPWGTLPGAREETRMVASLLAGATRLEGAAVTESALVTRLMAGGTVLHVSTHALADPTSFERNGLVVQPTESGMDTGDGLFDLREFAAQPLPFDLVVLSACSSGDGVLLTGQSLHGLVSAALDAGARGVVATRWRLDDAAIVLHMSRLYERLLAGDDAVSALHQVRREAMRSGVSPAIWANLEYFGDPTLHLVLQRRTPSMWARAAGTARSWLRALVGNNQP